MADLLQRSEAVKFGNQYCWLYIIVQSDLTTCVTNIRSNFNISTEQFDILISTKICRQATTFSYLQEGKTSECARTFYLVYATY